MVQITNLLQSPDAAESRQQLISHMLRLICSQESTPAYEVLIKGEENGSFEKNVRNTEITSPSPFSPSLQQP